MKKCPMCASESPDEAAFCIRCGGALASVTPTPAPAPDSDRPAPPIQPVPTAVVGPAGWPLPQDTAGQSPLGGAAPSKSNVLLILTAIGGAIFFVMIVAAIAIPNLLRSKMAANEASAVGSLRSLNTACVTYATTYGGFPPSLNALGGEDNGAAPSATAAQLIDTVLQTGQKYGYVFSYTTGSMDSSGDINSYTITANPVTPGSTGLRYFFTDQSGVIRAETSGPANQDSPPIS